MRNSRIKFIIILVLASFAFFIGCQNQNKKKSESKERKELNLLNWRFYIGDNTIKNFEKEFNAIVNVNYYASNEECYSKVKNSPGEYDIIIPSDYMVDIMINENLLSKLDMSKLPNIKHIDSLFLGENKGFDFKDEYSAPYMWGSTGFARNRDYIDKEIKSWKDVFNGSSKNITVLDDIRFTLGSVLMFLDKDPNTLNKTDIEAAASYLKSNSDRIKVWTQDSPKDMLINGDALVSYAWSGDVLQAAKQNNAIEYILPEDGALIFQDGICIPKGAPHNELAHEFINFILRPDVSAEITNTIMYGNPNTTAHQLIKPFILNNKAIFPEKEYLEKCKRIKDVGDMMDTYNELWNSIRAE